MSAVAAIGTYLPPWADGGDRVGGPDEDAVTMAVEAGSRAVGTVDRVVLVTRELPLLEGGNGAVVLAGLSLPDSVPVVEQVGGGPAVLDAIATSSPGTLVLAADAQGAGAVLIGPGDGIEPVGRVLRSLPVRVRTADGRQYEDDDPRLVRERGMRPGLARVLGDHKPFAVAGVSRRDTSALCAGDPPVLPTAGASSAVFALAALADERAAGVVAAVEQATVSALYADTGSAVVSRHEPRPRSLPSRRPSPGPDIKLSFAAYERAFDAKVRWQAGRCPSCGTLAMPPRHRCLGCGEEGSATLVALPRTGIVYTTTTIRVGVPGIPTPYSLAIVELDDVDVRVLVTVTDAEPGAVAIGNRGRLVLRRVATRTGVPDYGFAFSPEVAA